MVTPSRILDTGAATVAAFGANTAGSLFIAAGPTVTAVSPASGVASGTTAFTVTGTNFVSGAVITTTPTNGTCGVTTFVSSTSLTVTCTLGVAGTTATSLLVTNPNGGAATSAAVLAAATAPVAAGPFTKGSQGSAIAGRTVGITVIGGGVYGQPKVTSTGVGIKAAVAGDTGTTLLVKSPFLRTSRASRRSPSRWPMASSSRRITSLSSSSSLTPQGKGPPHAGGPLPCESSSLSRRTLRHLERPRRMHRSGAKSKASWLAPCGLSTGVFAHGNLQ